MMDAAIEFAVEMTCDSCVAKIKNSLLGLDGVKGVDISRENGTVVVETNLPSQVIKEKIESTGRRAVLNGYGSRSGMNLTGSGDSSNLTRSAVAMVGGTTGFSMSEKIKGIIRFVQADDNTCVIDGTVDGLTPGFHGLHLHECGDISRGCDSIGDHFDLNNSCHGGPNDPPSKRHTGDLGNVEANEEGRAMFRMEDEQIKVWDIIGRSIAVSESCDDLGRGNHPNSPVDGYSGKTLACGIISRSAGLFENIKKICACDGVTIWDERDRPLAGPGRSNH